MKPDSCTNYSSSQHSGYNNGNSTDNNRIRVIRLRRQNNVPLGFSVRGGREHGTGIYVSEVRAGTEAHQQGLLVGDQILRINGFNIEHAIHEEVLALLRAKPGVVIKVKSTGMIPVKDTKKDPLTWRIVEPGPTTADLSETSARTLVETHNLESRISIPSIGSTGLGCSIVKGPPDVPGIYVQSVKSGSLAEKAGLQIGDRIMEMNGHNFTNLDFPDAVTVLKSSKQMTLVLLKGVGLDLFPDEKNRRSRRNHPRQTDCKQPILVKDNNNPRDERDAKDVNGHNGRVKNGSVVNHGKDEDHKLNENSSCSDSDFSSRNLTTVQDSATKFSHCVKVRATVHSSHSDESGTHFVEKNARESGDGMDFETLSENPNLRNNCQSPWTNGNYNGGSVDSEGDVKSRDNNSADIDLFSSNLNYMKDFLKNNHSDTSIGSKSCSDRLSDDKSELSSLSSDDYLGIPKITTRLSGNSPDPNSEEYSKPQNEFLKRKQHELLMEEFREVHKKMFGQGPVRLTKPTNSCDFQDQTSLYKRRQQVRNDRNTPLPPPPPDIGINSGKVGKISHAFEPADEKFLPISDEKIPPKKRQREPPITDSRDPEPKPPQTYFDKPGLKPLVTIGPYANNSQQNRFLTKSSLQNKTSSEKEQRCLKSSSTELKSELATIYNQRITNSSASSTVPSSSSSEPRSPTSDSLLSSDSNFNPNSPPAARGKTNLGHKVPICDAETKVPTSFQATLSQFSKTDDKVLEKSGKENRLPSKSDKNSSLWNLNPMSKTHQADLEKEILKKEADGRQIQEIILKKNGPLNFAVEGGKNSDADGKIIVSEVWTGSCVTSGGKIEQGDQILMVDNTKLTGLSLTAAKIALRNANSNPNKETKFVIAKVMKDSG